MSDAPEKPKASKPPIDDPATSKGGKPAPTPSPDAEPPPAGEGEAANDPESKQGK